MLPCMGDGRQSGTSDTPSILNASPESAAGGGLAILHTGDRVKVDLRNRRVDVLLADEEIACAVETPPRAALPGPDPDLLDVEPREVAAWQAGGRALVLLDVRSPEEHALTALSGSRLIPLPDLERRLGELDPAAEIVVYCHYGPRSTYATYLLREHGFARAWNLAGGIDAWSEDVDPAVARY